SSDLAQAAPPRVRGHGVGQALELLRYDDDRRLPPVRDLDGVVDAPGGAAASVAQADDGDVDVGREVVELAERPLPFVGDPVARDPAANACARSFEARHPLVDRPFEALPRVVVADAGDAAPGRARV